jgi:peptidyl-prolyl cis-trans isomerase SurA
MRLLLISIIIFIPLKIVIALENKIITKIENEIITTIDIENEKNYLKALNPNIRNIDEDKLNLISKNSLIREKIKENEILKYTDKIKLDEKFLNGIIEQRYSRLKLNNRDQFLNYIKKYNIDIKTIEKKLSIEAIWNQLIYQKFSNKIKIDQNKLREDIKKKFSKQEKNFLLSEILFNIKNKNNLKKKYTEIIEDINKENFESAALIHSISDSSNLGGKLGRIKESSLNETINSELSNLKKGDISKPIFTPNGYLILKIDEIEYVKKKYDEKNELNELIRLKTNQQLNQQSIIYFNKIKKNTSINEL